MFCYWSAAWKSCRCAVPVYCHKKHWDKQTELDVEIRRLSVQFCIIVFWHKNEKTKNEQNISLNLTMDQYSYDCAQLFITQQRALYFCFSCQRSAFKKRLCQLDGKMCNMYVWMYMLTDLVAWHSSCKICFILAIQNGIIGSCCKMGCNTQWQGAQDWVWTWYNNWQESHSSWWKCMCLVHLHSTLLHFYYLCYCIFTLCTVSSGWICFVELFFVLSECIYILKVTY